MTQDIEDSRPGIGRYVPLACFLLTALVLLLIPLKIIGYGYLPVDDALADSAKAISGKPWTDILVLNSNYKIDNHIGWHAFLRQIYLLTGWDSDRLVIFSITFLFVLMAWSALAWFRRPEAWLMTMILIPGLAMEYIGRFMYGRPLMISLTCLMAILFLWRARGDGSPRMKHFLLMTAVIAAAVALHGVWYLWALLVTAFFLAQQYQWAWAVAASWIAGSILGGILTGHPVVYLVEAARQVLNVTENHFTGRAQVSEMRPLAGNIFGVATMGAIFLLRFLGKLPCRPWRFDPGFWMVCLGWALGWQAARFWTDWGLPAMMVLMACDIQLFVDRQLPYRSPQRLGLTAGLAATLYLVTTADVNGRWTDNLSVYYLDEKAHPELAGWMPEKGGILYEADMGLFFQTFFKNPKADWRYTVGFESVFMPRDDFDVYEKILWNNGDPKYYLPWVQKMKPADRLVLRRGPGRPSIGELEWNYVANDLWLGRLPKASQSKTHPKGP